MDGETGRGRQGRQADSLLSPVSLSLSASISSQVTKNAPVTVSTGYGTGVSVVKVTPPAASQHAARMLSVSLTRDLSVCR